MKAKEVREMTDQELEQKVKDFKAELFNLRFQSATGQLENPMRIKEIKKSFARVMTIMRERQLAQSK